GGWSGGTGGIGCFLVADADGVPTSVPWGIAFPKGTPPTDVPVHPTMLYETFWLMPVFAILWLRRGKSPFLFGEYLVLSGLGRLWIEVFRRNPDFVGVFSNAQIVALACITGGAASWLWVRANRTAVS